MMNVNFSITILFCVLALLSLVVQKLFFSSIRTPITFFSVLWSIVGAIANMGLYGYYVPSILVNLIIFIGIILFQIFFYIFIKNNRNNINDTDNMEILGNINYKMVYLVNFTAFLFLFPFFLRSIKIISSSGYAYLRAFASDTELGIASSGIQNSILDSFIRPIFASTSILSVVVSFSNANRKYKIRLLLVAIITNVCFAITNAARAPFVNFILYFLLGFVIFRGKNIFQSILKEKTKLFVCAVLFILIIYVTEERSMDGSGSVYFLKTLYTYYFSGPSYLTQLLDSQTGYGIGGKYFLGSATLGFITNFFSSFLILLTGKPQGSLYILGSVITNKQYFVAPDVFLNAMCTVFYNFLLDWGYIGIFLGPLILAIFSYILFTKAYKNSNILSFSLYLYWLNVLFRTIFKWDLLNLDFTVIYFSLLVFTYERKQFFKVKNN